MQELLKQRNQELVRDIGLLLRSIDGTRVPNELQAYETYITQVCQDLQAQTVRNLKYLDLNQQDLLEDILSVTKEITKYVRLLSAYLCTPILRASSSDRLSLTIIGWLHREHPQTQLYPPAIVDGSCSVLPFLGLPPVYFFPTVERRGLLYQPLLFHEYGHFMYRCHGPEMDDLVAELREKVLDLLRPVSQRNDRYAEERAVERQIIADTWYKWIQELFCDAIGFEIGGPSFLRAFSSFIGGLDQGDYYRQPEYLRFSDHPVTWLRVRFLTERARTEGVSGLAQAVEEKWRKVARIMDVVEDYHGFYHESLSGAIKCTINDMLVEAAPRKCTDAEAAGRDWSPKSDSPIRLLNWAWRVYGADPEQYPAWEAKQTKLFLSSFANP